MTTTLIINSGACGFTTKVTAEKNKDGKITLALETNCEMVQKMLEDIAVLDRFAPLTGFMNNPVYQSAVKHLKHVACPVPSGILKAIEVESGLNVPKDTTMTFVKKK
jgi:hypothetical protein